MAKHLFRKGHIPWNKDKDNPKLEGNTHTLGKHWKQKVKMSEKHKKIAIANLRPGWNKGKKMSEEFKQKIRQSLFGKIGKLSRNWQNGKSSEPYTIDWTETLKRAIRERDHYLCFICNQYGNLVHHINYDKKNCNSDNLITLCRKCHSKTNNNRNYWTNYFNKII